MARSSPTHGLGRLESTDHRDNAYLMRFAMKAKVKRPVSKYWGLPSPLNQGASSSCVGHGWRHFLSASPLPTRTGPSAFKIYDEATKVDEWADNDNDTARAFGTSVRAGAKVLSTLGHVAQYLWAFDLETMLDWLLTRGTVVVGTSWYAGMNKPDRSGYLNLTGEDLGGHCYLLAGANVRYKRIRMFNSWGPRWGEQGRAWIRFADMERLIAQRGEVCTAVERAVL